MVNSTTIKKSTEQKAPEASSTTNTAKGSFVNTLSQTLTAANAYLVSLLSQAGLKDRTATSWWRSSRKRQSRCKSFLKRSTETLQR